MTDQPYCEHSGCHDTITAYYLDADWWTGTAMAGVSALPHRGLAILMWFQRPEPWESGGANVRRLCTIHAREHFGVSIGGRIHA